MNSAATGEGRADSLAPDQSGEQPQFSLLQRLGLWFISWAGYLAIRAIGPTLRVSITYGIGAEGEPKTHPAIFCFWHRCVFAAAYVFRNRDIRVLTSRSYDGEYVARIIERLGFRPVRGSTSRGALHGLRELQRELSRGEFVAFTIDGPRGPRYVAKPGAVHLARMTGAPIFAFYVAVERAWILKTWDRFIIPKPFSRVHCYIHSSMEVSASADLDQPLARIQRDLEEAQKRAEILFPPDIPG